MTGSIRTLVRDLARRRGRERRGLALAEGVRLVEEVLATRQPLRAVLVAPALEATPRGQALKAALAAATPALEPVADAELVELAQTEHPQGVLAVIEPRAWRLDDIPAGRTILVLDAVQDPGNVGTMLRSALALGAGGVVALPGTAELLNPKVLRAAMGAHFRLPALAADGPALLDWAAARALPVWGATMDGPPIDQVPHPRPAVALVVGNEGAGLSPGVQARLARRVTIPLAGGAESLNVGVAAAILLWELRRG